MTVENNDSSGPSMAVLLLVAAHVVGWGVIGGTRGAAFGLGSTLMYSAWRIATWSRS